MIVDTSVWVGLLRDQSIPSRAGRKIAVRIISPFGEESITVLTAPLVYRLEGPTRVDRDVQALIARLLAHRALPREDGSTCARSPICIALTPATI